MIRTLAQAHQAITGKPHGSIEPIDPERIAAAEMAARRSETLQRDGWITRVWRPTSPGSPATQRHEYGLDWDHRLIDGWLDHPYRLVHRATQRTIYVSEPYSLSDDALICLHYLAKHDGWHITIRADMALHFPGHTVAIWIERPRTENGAPQP